MVKVQELKKKKYKSVLFSYFPVDIIEGLQLRKGDELVFEIVDSDSVLVRRVADGSDK